MQKLRVEYAIFVRGTCHFDNMLFLLDNYYFFTEG